MNPLRAIATGSAVRLVDVAVQVAAAFWITPLLISALGTGRYGLWVAVLTLVSYLDIFDLGLTSAVTRYVARALGRGDSEGVRRVIRTAWTLLLLLGLGCAVLVLLLAWSAPYLFGEKLSSPVVRPLILILGLTAALSFPARVFTGVLEGHVRYELTALASILRTLLSTAALWWVLREKADLLWVVTVVAGSGLFMRALHFFFARGICPEMRGRWGGTAEAQRRREGEEPPHSALQRPSSLLSDPLRLSGSAVPSSPDADTRRELLAYGGKNFANKLLEIVRFRIDAPIILGALGPAAVGLYAPGMSLIRYFREVIDSLGGVLMPVFSRTEGAGDRLALRRQLAAATRVCSAAATFLGGSIALYGGHFIERWIGPGFNDSYLVALILTGPFILAMAQNPGIALLYGLSRQERLLKLNLLEGALNVGLSLALVGPWGIFGVAAGTAVSLLLTKSLLQPLLLSRETSLPLREYYTALLLPIVALGAPMLAVYAALSPHLAPDYTRLALAGAVQTMVVAPVAWFILGGKSGPLGRALLR